MSKQSWLSRLLGRKAEGQGTPLSPRLAQRSPECETEYREQCDRAEQELAAGRHEEALACYDRALEIDPRDARPWLGKGWALVWLERPEEALACFDRCLEIEPRNSTLWCGRAEALHQLGRYQEALACCERGLKIDPRDSDLWMAKGSALYGLGRTQQSQACCRRAQELGWGRRMTARK